MGQNDTGSGSPSSGTLNSSEREKTDLTTTLWHPSPFELAKYLEGELDEISQSAIACHVERGECVECRYMNRASLFYL